MRIAHLWRRKDCGWEQQALAGDAFFFADASDALSPAARSFAEASACALFRSGSAASPAWSLVAAPGARIQVNGRAPVAGLRVLSDRDFIRTADGAEYYYSTESQAVVEPYPPGDRPVYCGRCRLGLDSGSLAVCCPGCGIWYHQGGDLPCWTYAEQCSYCGSRTALDAGYAWTPEE